MWFLGSQEINEEYVILPFYWVACYKPVLDYVYTVPVKFLSGRKFAQFILFIFCLYEAGYFKILLGASVICPSFTTWIWAVQPGSWVTSSKTYNHSKNVQYLVKAFTFYRLSFWRHRIKIWPFSLIIPHLFLTCSFISNLALPSYSWRVSQHSMIT